MIKTKELKKEFFQKFANEGQDRFIGEWERDECGSYYVSKYDLPRDVWNWIDDKFSKKDEEIEKMILEIVQESLLIGYLYRQPYGMKDWREEAAMVKNSKEVYDLQELFKSKYLSRGE